MITNKFDAVALGSCYVDTNVLGFQFPSSGIPVETELIGGDYENVPGGSAVNFCVMLTKLGLKTAFLGLIGDDPNGEMLEKLLEGHGVKPALTRKSGLTTNIGFNLTNPAGEHIMLIAGTANQALAPDAVMPELTRLLGSTNLLYLGGAFKLKAFAPAFHQIVHLAREHHAQLAIDHGRIPAGIGADMLEAVKALVRAADYYLPSRSEFCQLWEVGSIEDGLSLLARQAPKLTVVVKDGANGAWYWAGGSAHHVEGEKVAQVVNLTGAGDSFNAGLLASLRHDRPLAEAVGAACQVAAAKISGKPIA